MVSRVDLWHCTLARGACLSLLPAGARLLLGASQAAEQHGHRAPGTPVTVVSRPCCRLALHLASGAWAEPGGASIAMRRRRPCAPEGDRGGMLAFSGPQAGRSGWPPGQGSRLGMAGRPVALRRGAASGRRPLVLPRSQRVELLGAVSSEGPRPGWEPGLHCGHESGSVSAVRSGPCPVDRR